MKSLVISSNTSGGGKTTVTLGIMRALIKRGLKVQGYKVGPDYIDPAFHTHVTGKPSRNLDIYLMGEDGVKASYSRGCGDFGVIEGVMGLYDGAGITSKYSTAHVSKLLNLPVVLVMSPRAQSATLCAEINGLIDFEDVEVAGVILNNISEGYFKLLKACIEKNCHVKVFGYVPKDERLKLKSRHLGLVQSSEVCDLNERIDLCAKLMERYVDMGELMKCFREVPKFKDDYHVKSRNIKTGVCLDRAFSFYYRENIELLSEMGDVVFFSPISDKKIPEGIDFLYIGGGYPEVFLDKLSQNVPMLKSIKAALEGGLYCYAECGGLMYLTDNIDSIHTVGFFNGKSFMKSKLQNFGYAQIEVTDKNPLIPEGLRINCHEFHKSCVELNERKVYELTKTMYDGSKKRWQCGYVKNNTLGAYAHVHFFGNIKFLESMGERIKGSDCHE